MFWHPEANPGTTHLHKLIKTKYDQGKIPFEVRTRLFPWIENRFLRNSPSNPATRDVKRIVAEFLTELKNSVELLKRHVNPLPTTVDVIRTLETAFKELSALSAPKVHQQLLFSMAGEAELVNEELKMRQDAAAGNPEGTFNWELRMLTTRCLEYRLAYSQWDPNLVTTLLNDINHHLILSDALMNWKWSEKLPQDDSSIKKFHNNYSNFLEEFLALQNCGLVGPSVVDQYQSMVSFFLKNGLAVQMQPPDVVTTTVKFSVSLRWPLSGNVQYSLKDLKISLINGHGADQLVANDEAKPKKLATITHKPLVMEDGQLKINDIKMKKVLRSKKGPDGPVMSELFALYFRCKIVSGDKTWRTWCCSRPFPVGVHSLQRTEAEATLFWYEAFQEDSEDMPTSPAPVPITQSQNCGKFKYPQSMSWDRMSRALTRHFKKSLNSNWHLTPFHLDYLKSRIFNNSNNVGDEILFKNWNKSHIILKQNETRVTVRRKKTLFTKKSIPVTVTVDKISFWRYWSAIIQLIADHLMDMLNDGLILGFISREEAFRRLVGEACGTFLVRFSDTILGGVTICIVGQDKRSGVKKVEPRKPFTELNLRQLPLHQHILQTPAYRFVYSVQEDQVQVQGKEDGFHRFIRPSGVEEEEEEDEIQNLNERREDPYVHPQVLFLFHSNLHFNIDTPPLSSMMGPSSSSSINSVEIPTPPNFPVESSQMVGSNGLAQSSRPQYNSSVSSGLGLDDDMDIGDIVP